MMSPMAGGFARCRPFWPKGFYATRAPFIGYRLDSTHWSRSFWPWLCWRWCVVVRWSRAAICPPASGANCSDWMGGRRGAPFFFPPQPVNPGLIAVLRQSIVPRLVAEAPQPSAEALAADRLLPRFSLIFDREGYSPK